MNVVSDIPELVKLGRREETLGGLEPHIFKTRRVIFARRTADDSTYHGRIGSTAEPASKGLGTRQVRASNDDARLAKRSLGTPLRRLRRARLKVLHHRMQVGSLRRHRRLRLLLLATIRCRIRVRLLRKGCHGTLRRITGPPHGLVQR